MPKSLSHTVVFTDDLDAVLRLCTEVANLSPIGAYEVDVDILERLFGWSGLTEPARAAFVGESPGGLDLVEIPGHLRGEVAPGMRLLAVANRDAQAAAAQAASAGFEVRGPLTSTTMDGGTMAFAEVTAGGLAFELVQFG